MTRFLRPSHGAALIMVLWLVLLLVVIVVSLTWTTSVERAMAENEATALKLDAALQSGVAYASGLLAQDARAERSYDATDEPWSGEWTRQVGQVELTGRIEDEQGKFNVLLLARESGGGESAEAQLQDLIKALDLSGTDAGTLSSGVKSWITEKQPLTSSLTAKGDNRALGGSAPMFSVMELELVDGIDRQQLMGSAHQPGLASYITTWGTGKVNLNTTTAPVLLGLHPELEERDVNPILARRDSSESPSEPFETVDELKEVEGFDRVVGPEGTTLFDAVRYQLTVKSDVFRVVLTVRLGKASRQVWVHLRRDGNKVEVMQYVRIE